MKVIRKVSSKTASEKPEKATTEKFVANETDSSCFCCVSDG